MIVPSTDQKQGRTLRKILLAIVLGLICLSIGLAAFHKTPWIVPPAEKARKNPLTASDENLRAAKRIYRQKCDNCHGEAGKGDGSDARMYDPAPSDLTDSAKIDQLTDGEIFYQITEGRKPMPAFRKKLTDEQRWQLVLLVRAFAARQNRQPGGKQTEEPGTDK
jgi:mono/diheme cytochrome c family protein